MLPERSELSRTPQFTRKVIRALWKRGIQPHQMKTSLVSLAKSKIHSSRSPYRRIEDAPHCKRNCMGGRGGKGNFDGEQQYPLFPRFPESLGNPNRRSIPQNSSIQWSFALLHHPHIHEKCHAVFEIFLGVDIFTIGIWVWFSVG